MDLSNLPGEWSYNTEFSGLKNLVITDIYGDEESDELVFKTANGRLFIMNHVQDCCESVYIDDICGDLSDIKGVTFQEFILDESMMLTDHEELLKVFTESEVALMLLNALR